MFVERHVNVSGLQSRYLEAGQGEVLLLIHGGHFGSDGSADGWVPTMDRFAKYYHTYALDKPGQGFTDNPRNDSDYVIGFTVQQTYQFLRVMGIERVHLVGHSRGGYTASRLTLEHPEMVKTLTIVNSSTLITRDPVPGQHGLGLWHTQLQEKVSHVEDPRERHRQLVAGMSFGNAHITDDWLDARVRIEELPKMRKAFKKMGDLNAQFFQNLKACVEETHAWIKAGRLKCPTLIVWGFNDPSAPLESAGLDTMRLILANVPKSRMCVLNQAGHFCFREQPDAFAGTARGFIESV